MNNILEPKNLTSNSYYAQAPGTLGVQNSVGIDWHGCRENFHFAYDNIGLSKYLYVVMSGILEFVPKFIACVEEHLKIEPRSFFRFTNKNNVICVEASPWWVSQPMRHSFFTICLRAGLNYNGSDWYRTLIQHPYFFCSKEAVDRFLEGRTDYTGNVRGWRRQFSDYHPSTEDIKALLLYPESPEERHKKIETLSYFMWEKEGRQKGKDDIYWRLATQEYYKERK